MEKCQDRYADTFDPSEFSGQYKHLGPVLVARDDDVYALKPKVQKPTMWKGVKVIPYMINRRSSNDAHPWIIDLEAKNCSGRGLL